MVEEENHEGQSCIVEPALLCQGGYCANCCIWRERDKPVNGYEANPYPVNSRMGSGKRIRRANHV